MRVVTDKSHKEYSLFTPLLHKLKIEMARRPFFKVVGEEDEGRSKRAVANGRAMLALIGGWA